MAAEAWESHVPGLCLHKCRQLVLDVADAAHAQQQARIWDHGGAARTKPAAQEVRCT